MRSTLSGLFNELRGQHKTWFLLAYVFCMSKEYACCATTRFSIYPVYCCILWVCHFKGWVWELWTFVLLVHPKGSAFDILTKTWWPKCPKTGSFSNRNMHIHGQHGLLYTLAIFYFFNICLAHDCNTERATEITFMWGFGIFHYSVKH